MPSPSHLPITCGQIVGGSGDSHFSWGHVTALSLGSTIDPRQGVVGSLSHRTRQPFEFLIHLLSFVVGEHALRPKHDFYLHFQGQHVAKRLVLGIH